MKTVQVLSAGVGAFVLLGTLAACAQPGEAADGYPGYLDKLGTTAAYTAEASKRELAPGWSWPEEPYSGEGPDGQPAVYGVGTGEADASLYWYCSWGRSYLSLEDGRDRQLALNVLLAVEETPFFSEGLTEQDQQAWRDDIIGPAREGEMLPISDFIRLNCSEESS